MASRWILRHGSKTRGFRYIHADGRVVRDARTLRRIEQLRVPPAWRDVHIAAGAGSAVQAWGFDSRGRRQYRYHERAVERGTLRKYYRVRQLGRDLPAIRAATARDFQRCDFSRACVAAAVVRLIGAGFFRVGNERSVAENQTFGVTTLRTSHVSIEGDCLRFRFVGKSHIRQRQCVVDRRLARYVARLMRAAPGARLFRYRDADGAWTNLTARDINEYLRSVASVPYTAKDFRTWGGTLRAAIVLSEIGPPRQEREAQRSVALAMRLVSAELGNTPAICRQSYVHPIVVARYLDEGETIAPRAPRRRSPAEVAHLPEERALLRFLDRYFPERRKRPRRDVAA